MTNEEYLAKLETITEYYWDKISTVETPKEMQELIWYTNSANYSLFKEYIENYYKKGINDDC